MRIKELLLPREQIRSRALRNAVYKFHPRLIEPIQHFAESMLGFVWVFVLVVKPCLFPDISQVFEPEARIEELKPVAGQAENVPPEVGSQPTIGVIKPNDDKAALPHTSQNRPERRERIACMMEHSVRDNKIETLWPEHRPEEVHLKEVGSLDLVLGLEALPKFQGVQANVSAENCAPPCQAEKVAELAGSATALEDLRTIRNLIIEQPRKKSLISFGSQTFRRVHVVVVRERRLLIKRPH